MNPRILALLPLLLPAAASAYELKTDSSRSVVTFAGKQMVFQLQPPTPAGLTAAEVKSAAQAAMDAWSAACRLSLGTEAGSSSESSVGAIRFVESNWSHDANALAVTVVKIEEASHRIVGADIELNAQSHRFRALAANSLPGGVYDDLQNALTHELGHAIGLGHSADLTAVMSAQTAKGEVSKRALKADDVAGAAALYGKLLDVPPQAAAMQDLAEGMTSTGCSVAPSGPMILAGLIALIVLLAGRRRAPAPVPVRERRAPPARR
jgi:MYXO-CTERM domain-containing protein